MKKIDLGQTLTIVANIGVIGGLIFVGLQLRQERQIAIAENMDGATARATEWVHVLSENADVWQKGLTGEPLSDTESRVFDAMVVAWEAEWYTGWLRSNLTVSEQESIRFAREAAIDLHLNPGLLNAWNNRRERLRYAGSAGAIPRDDANAPVWESVVRQELDALQKAGLPN